MQSPLNTIQTFMKKLFIAFGLSLFPFTLLSQPLTRPEKTQYTETSRYEDVIAYLNTWVKKSPMLKQTSFGYTLEGRSLPLIVWGKVRDASPEAVKASGKLRFFVMANIHAGEVEGKEAMQLLIRDLAQGKHKAWADSVVLLIAPIYNADGNERVRLTNRPLQLGPIGGMGQRPNAQDLDLNRDHMKLESPEAHSLIRLLAAYDPHVWMDLHTTDGSVHAYHLTYAPPLNPNTSPEIASFLRTKLLPSVTERIKQKHGWAFYHYGNLPETGPGYTNGEQPERGWYSFDHRPRFSNNYASLRNNFGILSEAYSYATFQERILATQYFVEECVQFAYQHAKIMQQLKANTDRASLIGKKLALRAALYKSEKPETILLGEVKELKHPYTGETMWERLATQRPESMPVYLDFKGTEFEEVPAAYFLPTSYDKLVEKLETHGIQMKKVQANTLTQLQFFQIDSTKTARYTFQGHKERQAWGKWTTSTTPITGEYWQISMEQPLAKLAFYLLEPRSDDGFLNWNFFDQTFEKQAAEKQSLRYPVLRQYSKSP